MTTWPDIRSRIAATRVSELRALAELAGVPVATLTKIKYGQTRNPRIETVIRLQDHFSLIDRRAERQDVPA